MFKTKCDTCGKEVAYTVTGAVARLRRHNDPASKVKCPQDQQALKHQTHVDFDGTHWFWWCESGGGPRSCGFGLFSATGSITEPCTSEEAKFKAEIAAKNHELANGLGIGSMV